VASFLQRLPPAPRLFALVSGVGQEKSQAIRFRDVGKGAVELCKHATAGFGIDASLQARAFEVDQERLPRCSAAHQKVVGCKVVLEKTRVVGAPGQKAEGGREAGARARG